MKKQTPMKKNLPLIILFLCLVSCSETKKEPQNEPTEEIAAESQSESPKEKVETSEPENIEADDFISFYFTPSVDDQLVREKGQILLDYLSNETKLNFEIHIPKNYDEMIADFGNGKADVAIMNSLSYVKAHEQFGVSAKLRAVRYGKSTYLGQIITNVNSNINSIEDLQGKTIAYTDRSSTSGYLFPKIILKKAEITPGKTVFAGKHDTVVKMVYEGIADAGATFYSEPSADGTIRDARARLIDKYPDVAEKVNILVTTDPIPNDPVVFSKDLPTDISYKISLGMIKFISTDQGKDVMTAIYSTEGFVRCADSDYDDLREAMKE